MVEEAGHSLLRVVVVPGYEDAVLAGILLGSTMTSQKTLVSDLTTFAAGQPRHSAEREDRGDQARSKVTVSPSPRSPMLSILSSKRPIRTMPLKYPTSP